MKVQLIHSSLNFTQNIPECMTVVGTRLKGSHFNVNLLNTAQQVINLEITLSQVINQTNKDFNPSALFKHLIQRICTSGFRSH